MCLRGTTSLNVSLLERHALVTVTAVVAVVCVSVSLWSWLTVGGSIGGACSTTSLCTRTPSHGHTPSHASSHSEDGVAKAATNPCMGAHLQRCSKPRVLLLPSLL